MSKLTAESVTAAIRDMNGNISAVAKRLGVCRQTVYTYIERHPSVKDVLAESRETMIDNAESALYRAVRLFVEMMRGFSCKRWADPFLGTGATLLACENLGKQCYGMELDPTILAVCLERMAAAGLEPTLEASR